MTSLAEAPPHGILSFNRSSIERMKTLARCTLLALVLAPLALVANAQMAPMRDHGTSENAKPIASPPAQADVQLDGKTVTIKYNSPRMRGRKVMGELVPYNQEWRTGANPATTLITPVDLMIGDLKVPAGTYTLFTLPSEGTWKFIVSKKTGEWGIPYPAGNDLGRTTMMKKSLSAPEENMSISFEHTMGKKTQLHVKWETTDVYVPVVAQ
jgi:hypothetical protein